jgi:hypothetical protein
MFGNKKNRFSAKSPLVFCIFMMISICCAPFAGAQSVKIMPLGDSITGTPGCWRAILWNQLQDAGYTDIDFVGTQTGQTCSLPFDNDCEGHGGIKAVDIANQNQLPPWLAAANPDIVMMHLGTNDLLTSTITLDMVLSAYSIIVDQMRANNPSMKILVAQIIPMYTASSGCTACYQNVVELNAAIPAWAAGKTTSRSPVVVVDQWTGFDSTVDTNDGIHPTDSGNQKIADTWFPPLTEFLDGTVPTTAPTIAPTPVTGMTGDVNGDGSITIVDALLTAQYYVNLNPAGFISENADTDCDGSIDIIDALLIAQYYVGLITALC